MKKLFVFSTFVLLFPFAFQAQIVGRNAFIKATGVEIGVNGNGGFEGANKNYSPIPIGMHHRSNTDFFGFVANPQKNAWATFDGDFFTPGTPENGWGIRIGASGAMYGNNCKGIVASNKDSVLAEIPGSITEYSNIFNCYSATWTGNKAGLLIKVNYFLQQTDLFYTTTVTITNNTGAAIPELYYYRSLDPDNNITQSNDYKTTNKVESQPGGGSCDIAHVSASQTSPWNSYLGLAAIGPNWRSGYGGFSNRDGAAMYNGTGFTQTVGSSALEDKAIYLANKIQNLANGATEVLKFVVILNQSDKDKAINGLMRLTYPGSSTKTPSICVPYADTVKICSGVATNIKVEGATVNNFTWAWSPTTGLNTGVGPSVMANPLVTTSYTVTGTPLNACVQPIVMSFIVVSAPSATADVPANISVCAGATVNATNFTSTPVGGAFSWTNSNTAIGIAANGTGNIPSFVATNNTNFPIVATIGVNATLPGGCFGPTTNYTITVNPGPVLKINNPSSVCSPTTVDLTAAAITAGSTGGGTLSYWTDAACTISLVNPNAVATSGTYYIKAFNGATCFDIKPVTVVVNAAPNLIITNPADVCLPTTVDITSAAVTVGSTGLGTLTYWTDASATNSLTNPTAISTSATYYIKAGSGTACSVVKPVIVSITAQPVLVITSPSPVCGSSSSITTSAVTAGSTGGGVLSYWMDAACTIPLLNPSAISTSGLYYIKATNSSVCFDIKPVSVTVNPFPTLVITNPTPVCSPLSVKIDDPAIIAGSTPGGTSSYWMDAACTIPILNTNISVAGVYYIKYALATGCSDIKPVTISINATPVLNINNPSVCVPNKVDISGSFVTNGSTGGGVLTYWSDAACTVPLTTTVFSTTGTYYIKATTSAGCFDVKPVVASVNPIPTVTFLLSDNQMCLNETPMVLTEGKPSGGTYNGTSVSSGKFNPANGVGTYTIVYNYTDANNCSSSATDKMTVLPIPAINVGSDTSICFSRKKIFERTISSSYQTIQWSNGYTTPKVVHTAAGPLSVTVSGSNGCKNSDTLLLTDYCDKLAIQFPNVITPNGDGINDAFTAKLFAKYRDGSTLEDFYNEVQTISFIVYDRWGKKMFESTNEAPSWDGTYKGELVAAGTYFWLVSYTDKTSAYEEFNGWVNVIK